MRLADRMNNFVQLQMDYTSIAIFSILNEEHDQNSQKS